MSRCFHESVRRGWHLGFKHLLVGLTKQAPFYCLIFIGGKFLLVRYPSRSGPPRVMLKIWKIPQTAFMLWGSYVLIKAVSGNPPPEIRARSFLLLFTTLLHRTMHFVYARRSVGPLLLKKRRCFDHSNGPLALKGPLAPDVHK